MKNSLTFHHTDTATVMTGESSIVDSGIIAHPLPDERVLVRIKWGHGDKPVWAYNLSASTYFAIIADGLATGSLGRIANGVKREAVRAYMDDTGWEVWPVLVDALVENATSLQRARAS